MPHCQVSETSNRETTVYVWNTVYCEMSLMNYLLGFTNLISLVPMPGSCMHRLGRGQYVKCTEIGPDFNVKCFRKVITKAVL